MLQVRVEHQFDGRVEAGAPQPERSLAPEEVLSNLRYFTEERRGPRTSPCTRLVLSGQGVLKRADVPAAIRSAREWGVDWVTLHVGGGDIEFFDVDAWKGLVDAVVVPVEGTGAALQGTEALMAAAGAAGIRVISNLQLGPERLSDLGAVLDVLVRVRPHSAVFTHPFPRGEKDDRALASLDRVMDALVSAQRVLQEAEIAWNVKGLPVCWLTGLGVESGRSSNRWYVDASHQKENALLFFPDVVRMSKTEPCRFCARNLECDGFFEQWLARGGYPSLEPIGD